MDISPQFFLDGSPFWGTGPLLYLYTTHGYLIATLTVELALTVTEAELKMLD